MNLSEEAKLRELLRPLPPLSFFRHIVSSQASEESDFPNAAISALQADKFNDNEGQKQDVATENHKLRETTPLDNIVPPDILTAVDAIRRAGALADTIFLGSLPPQLSKESALRAAMHVPVRSVKIIQSGNRHSISKTLAWVAFFNEADCVQALLSLRRNNPNLNAGLHKPKVGGGVAGPSHASLDAHTAGPSARDIFNTRADKVVAEGGLGDTIMLRGMPREVTESELIEIVESFGTSCRPLRTRTSESRDGTTRNFWLSYTSRGIASEAFEAMLNRHVSFRCGKSQNLVPVVHNDATDAESKKRRQREMALGIHASAGDFEAKERTSSIKVGPTSETGLKFSEEYISPSRISKLESFLRSDGLRLYFLSPST